VADLRGVMSGMAQTSAARFRPMQPGTKKSKFLRRLFKIIKSSRITRWQIAIDTGDNVKNAWLYNLNFYPAFCHLHINFFDENYLFLEIRNAPWKMVYALMK